MKYLALAVLGVIVSYLSYVFVYTGAFKSVKIEKLAQGPEFQMVYKEHTGPYHEIDKTITEVEEWMEANNLRCPSSFGYYLDNPDEVDEDRLRSHGGCLVSTAVSDLPEKMQFKKMDTQAYVRASFDGSPALGPLKVYPKALEYMKDHGLKHLGPVLEVYTLTGANRIATEYYFPYAK